MVKIVLEKADIIPLLGEVFRRYGFDGTSIALISEHTKLGKGSLYHFFPGGKDEMAKAVLADISDWFETNIFLPLKHNETDALANMFSAVETYFKTGRRICLIGALALVETRDRFAEEVKQYFSRWIEILATHLVHLGHDKTQALQLATTTIAGIQGAIIVTQALNDEQYFNNVMQSLRQLNLRH